MVGGALAALALDGVLAGGPVSASVGAPLDPGLAVSVFNRAVNLDLPELRPADLLLPRLAIERAIPPTRIARATESSIPRTAYPTGGVPRPERYAGAPIPPLRWPTDGEMTSPFGYRVLRGRFRHHAGLDIRAPHGTPVRAAAPGAVVYAGTWGGYGRLVVIDHGGGIRTWYAHNQRLKVRTGQTVEAGDVIADAGATGHAYGPHTHFELRLGDVPVDPRRYMEARAPLAVARTEPVEAAASTSAPTPPEASAVEPPLEGVGGP